MLPITMGSLIRLGERQTRHTTTLCSSSVQKKKKQQRWKCPVTSIPLSHSPTQHDCTVLERRSEVRPVHKKKNRT